MSGQQVRGASVGSVTRSNGRAIGHYILGKTIGEGTFGKVKLGTHVTTGENVAIKVLEKDRIVDVADVERVAREIHILKLIRHPHVVQLFEIVETNKQLYLIMEYASGGELFDYIVAKTRVKELEAVKFFRQIVAGVCKVHEMNVVHRDLKPENLLLDEHSNIKIVDFGLSNSFKKDSPLLQTACGSPCYAAPEMIAGKRYVPACCDMWSCGVILFAMVCGYLPFEDANTASLYKKILNARYHCPADVSESVRHLISCILCTDPQRRYTVQHIRQHPWYHAMISNESARQNIQFPISVNGGCDVRSCHRCTRWYRRAPNEYVETDVLEQCAKYGFSQEYTTRCLQMNKHNHCTTTYYLLLEKKTRMADKVDGSDEYDKFFSFDKIDKQEPIVHVERAPCPEPRTTARIPTKQTTPDRIFNAPARKPRVDIGIITPRKPRVGLVTAGLSDPIRVQVPRKDGAASSNSRPHVGAPTMSLRMTCPIPTLKIPPHSIPRPRPAWNAPRSVASSCPPNADPTRIPFTRVPLTARGSSGGIPLSLRTRPLTARGSVGISGIQARVAPLSARGIAPASLRTNPTYGRTLQA